MLVYLITIASTSQTEGGGFDPRGRHPPNIWYDGLLCVVRNIYLFLFLLTFIFLG